MSNTLIKKEAIQSQPLMRLWKFVPFKSKILGFWANVPFGSYCSIKVAAETMSLQKNLMVVVTDGRTSDELPVYLVSSELVSAFGARMKFLGYPMPKEAN